MAGPHPPADQLSTAGHHQQLRTNRMAAGLGYPDPYPDEAGLVESLEPGRPTIGATPSPYFTPASSGRAPSAPVAESVLPGYADDRHVVVPCGHCGGDLNDGESHLHGGAENDPAMAPIVAAWRAASERYTKHRAEAFAAFRTASDAAWLAYQRAMADAGAAYDRRVLEVSREYDLEVISWRVPRDLPMLPPL